MFPITGEKDCRKNTAPKALLSVLLTSLTIFPVAGHTSVISDTFNDLTTGDTTTISLINYYKSTEKYTKYKPENIDGIKKQHEWGQSVGLFYKTGKTRIGETPVKASFNLGYGYVFELDTSYPGDVHNWNAGEKIFQSKECFWTGKEPGTGQYKCKELEGYGKLPVANMQLNWRDGSMKIGDGFYTVGLISTADPDDALLSSYRGIMLKQKYQEYFFDGAYVTGFMAGNDDEMGDLTGNSNYYDINPLTYDYLYTARVRRKFGLDGGYQIAYGEAKDYLRRYHTDAWYRMKLNPQSSLLMKAQYYYNHEAGDLWQQELEKGQANFQSYASALSYEFQLDHDAWSLWYGFTKINAPLDNPDKNGSFSYGFGNAKGWLKLPTTGGYHGFRRDGTEAMVVGLSYDFRHLGLKDLKLSYRYHWADSPIKGKASGDIEYGSEFEHVIEAKYIPKSGMLKGLNFNFKQSFYRPDDTIAQLTAEDIPNKADKTAIKLIIGYSFNL